MISFRGHGMPYVQLSSKYVSNITYLAEIFEGTMKQYKKD